VNLSTHPTLAAALGKAKVGGIVLAATVVLAGTAEAATSVDLFVDDAAPVATTEPTSTPADCPTEEPVTDPSIDPTDGPAAEPTATAGDEPSSEPTDDPTEEATTEPATTDEPTAEPTECQEPTDDPTGEPTDDVSDEPTEEATDDPTDGGRLRGREEPRGVRLRRREGHTPRARPWCSSLRGRAQRLRQGQGRDRGRRA